MLTKQIHLYSIDTSAFYDEKEQFYHKRLLKLYKLRLNDYPSWRKASINRVIKKEKNKLVDLLNKRLESDIPRRLNPEALKDKAVISLFESSLTRALGIKTNELTKDLMILNVYFFQVFENLVKNGFIYNDEKYIFLTASAGQIRTKKAVFIKESRYLTIQKQIMCGLDIDKINSMGGININKFCAYLALSNSATDMWEDFDIHRAIVVDDFETCFKSEVDFIDYITYDIERKNMQVEIPCTDGWGLVDGETTRMVRLPWIKGLLSNFPLQKYLKEKCSPEQWVIKDIWGQEHNVVEENIKYIFTKSQMKLHKFYSSWNEYCDNFIKYNCTANYCNIEEDIITNTRINYQMLQQLVDVTHEEIQQMVSQSVKEIEEVGNDYQITMKLLGATEFNKNPNYFQQALMIYPELFRDPYCREILKDTKRSLVKQAKGGRLRVNGKYLFVAPNPIAFCDYIFKGEKNPKDDLNFGEVYTNQFPDGTELALLRSPSLGKEWGIRKNKRNEELDKWLGNSKCIYTSSYDTISKLLSFDCDGDKLLVLQDKNLIKLGKRLMKNVVPLYYEMKKANPNIITPENLYKGISLAFTAGNIGPASNLITIVKNNNEENREEADKVVKWLTMEVNFLIDGAKTLFFLERPKEIDKIIKKHTKGKVPNFFIYAKDKNLDQVEEPNDSTMNRIAKEIPNPRIRFNKNIGKFDYKMLMNHNCSYDTNCDSKIIQSYDYWNNHQYYFMIDSEKHQKQEDLYVYQQIRNRILSENKEDIDYIVNTLIMFLYTVRTSSQKKTLWACFGDIILQNLKNNLVGSGKICKICGRRFVPKNKGQKAVTCSEECSKAFKNQTKRERRNFQ